jgi:hypothetical protein
MDGGEMMGKHRNALRAMVVVALALGLVACANPVLDKLIDQAVIGDWVNPAYSGSNFPTIASMTVKAGGAFTYIDGMYTLSTGSYVIEAEWAGSDGHYFKIVYTAGAMMTYYTLLRISSDGQTYESNTGAVSTFPTVVDSGDPSYVILHRP